MSSNVWSSIVPSSTSGNQLATILNDFKNAVMSGLIGAARPSETQAGGFWVDAAASPIWVFKMYTGVVDVPVFSINTTTNVASILSSEDIFTISKTSDDSIGAVLKLLKKRVAGNGQTLDGDVLGRVDFYATRDSGVSAITASIKSISSDDTTASAQGTYTVFEVTLDATNTVVEAMRVYGDKVQIPVDTFTPSVEITDAFYIGDKSVDGNWRLKKVGANLEIQVRVAGVWTTKDSIAP